MNFALIYTKQLKKSMTLSQSIDLMNPQLVAATKIYSITYFIRALNVVERDKEQTGLHLIR